MPKYDSPSALFRGKSGPHEPLSKWYLDWFIHFNTAHAHGQQTNTQTIRASCVTTGGILF